MVQWDRACEARGKGIQGWGTGLWATIAKLGPLKPSRGRTPRSSGPIDFNDLRFPMINLWFETPS